MKAVTLSALFATVIAATIAGAVASHGELADGRPTLIDAGAPPPSNASGSLSANANDNTHSFYFTRVAYGSGGFRRSGWAVDFPDADLWIINVLSRLTGIDIAPNYNVIELEDPNLRRFPFIYALEVGSMGLSPGEVQGLRDYLLAGGFLMIDDFWGSWEWENFEREIRQVLPEYDIVELPLTHEIFSSYYQINEIIQVPNIGNGRNIGFGNPGARTSEQDGIVPYCLGIFDDEGRLMVVINWNTDLGDAWEHAEDPYYPLQFSTYAYQMVANFIIYAMTH